MTQVSGEDSRVDIHYRLNFNIDIEFTLHWNAIQDVVYYFVKDVIPVTEVSEINCTLFEYFSILVLCSR